MMHLVPARDAHFAWMLGEAEAPDRLALPPGGLDTPPILRWLRRTLPKLGGYGSWLMVADGEVVGMCSYKWPPTEAGGSARVASPIGGWPMRPLPQGRRVRAEASRPPGCVRCRPRRTAALRWG